MIVLKVNLVRAAAALIGAAAVGMFAATLVSENQLKKERKLSDIQAERKNELFNMLLDAAVEDGLSDKNLVKAHMLMTRQVVESDYDMGNVMTWEKRIWPYSWTYKRWAARQKQNTDAFLKDRYYNALSFITWELVAKIYPEYVQDLSPLPEGKISESDYVELIRWLVKEQGK